MWFTHYNQLKLIKGASAEVVVEPVKKPTQRFIEEVPKDKPFIDTDDFFTPKWYDWFKKSVYENIKKLNVVTRAHVSDIDRHDAGYHNTTRITNTTTLDSTYYEVFCNGTFTVNLPAGETGRSFRIINCGSGVITINPNGAELLTGLNASRTINPGSIRILTYETIEGWW